ncbi:MAG: hypothetical protein AB7W47_15665 [Calditrichaceae bacterium]
MKSKKQAITELCNLIHHYNDLWHLSRDHCESARPAKNILERRKTGLQNLLLREYADQIELSNVTENNDYPEGNNVVGILIRGTDLNACHIPLNEIENNDKTNTESVE